MPVTSSTAPRQSLEASLAELRRLYPPAASITDPLALIVWENVGYLVSDAVRQSLFDELARRIGLDATALATARQDVLLDIASRGGMRPAERTERLRRIGQIALEAGGDLAVALRQARPREARKLLKRFPGVGDPGADKILLFCGVEARPALESNGVRVLARLGHAGEGASYAQAYRGATAALLAMGPPDRERLTEAFQVFRAHGQALCKRAAPLCAACPLDAVCAHAPAKGL